jgi:outer membrane lipoprotein-sorting protein
VSIAKGPNVRIQHRLAGLASVAIAIGLAGASHAQTADELVTNNLNAKGGLENLRAVQSMKITARVTLPARGDRTGLEIPITIITKKQPNRFRQESEFQGQKIVIGFDGTTAWTLNSKLGGVPSAIEGDRLDAVKQQADLEGPLVDYKAKGTTIEHQGVEALDGRNVHKLKLTPKTGRPVTLYLDAETGLETKTVMEPLGDGTNEAVRGTTLETLFSRYQVVGNLTIPHTIQQKVNGQAMQIDVDKIEVSPVVEDSVFAMPVASTGSGVKLDRF